MKFVVDASVFLSLWDRGDSARISCENAVSAIAKEHDFVKHALLYAEIMAAIRRKTLDENLVKTGARFLDRLPGKFIPLDNESTKKLRRLPLPLRGADLIYAGLAAANHAPLVTLDREMLTRAGAVITVLHPADLES